MGFRMPLLLIILIATYVIIKCYYLKYSTVPNLTTMGRVKKNKLVQLKFITLVPNNNHDQRIIATTKMTRKVPSSNTIHGIPDPIKYAKKYFNRKFIKTREEMESTKNSPLIDPGNCEEKQSVTIFIMSVPEIEGQFYEKRNILRKTVVSEAQNHSICVYFVIGLSRNQTINQLIKSEANKIRI